MMENVVDEISPTEILELFKNDIRGESIQERLFTAGNMYLIAAALGPQQTRSSLIPFLLSDMNFDGEVKAIIAEQLGTFVKYVGGSGYAHVLIDPLKLLVDSEEIFVRDKAVQALAAVCSSLPRSEMDPVISKLLLTMFASPQLTFKNGACALMPYLYELVTDQSKSKLRRSFISMMKDETPSVRRAALAALPSLVNALKQNVIMEIVRQGLQERLTDDDESIRVMIPSCLPAIAARIAPQERAQIIVPMSKTLVKDSSWWVRANMAKNLTSIIPYFGNDIVGTDIGANLVFLLRDPDPEVKTAACLCCKQIVDVLAKVQTYFIDNVLPEIQALVSERFKQVREEVAADLLYFAKIVPTQIAEERIFPHVASLIMDKERDVVIAVLRSLSKTFGGIDSWKITKAVLPKIIEVNKRNPDWRVKVEIIRNFCIFLPFVTKEAIPIQIIPLIKGWLEDNIFAVRDEMAHTLPDFLQVVQGDQTMPFNEILDQIISLIMRLNHSNHIFVKQSGLNAVNYIGTVLSSDVITDKILPTVILLSSDRCVNVRIVAAKTLNRLKNYVTPQGLNKIKLSLKPLLHDPDPDVQYFASHPC